MINLREEILHLLVHPKNDLVNELVWDIQELAKRWALEIVGEDLALSKNNKEVWGDTALINFYRETIRQRIEESTK